MEALRLLQHDIDQPSTSTADEIINYIKSHYRHDGDLYAQVRTALRQVCSQGFVMKLLGNEYHFVGSVASLTKRDGCSLDCKGRTTDFLSKRRRNVYNGKNDICDCVRFPIKYPRQNSRLLSSEESYKTSTADHLESSVPIFHSTAVSNVRDTTVHQDEFNAEGRNDRRGAVKTEQRGDHMEPIPGPSRRVLGISSSVPTGNFRKTQMENRKVQRADETNDEDIDSTSDAEVVTRNEYSTNRPFDRSRRITRNQRNEYRHSNDEEVGNDNDDKNDKRGKVEKDDESTEEDSVYEELNARPVRRRTTPREQELKRWIRRCRQECERQRKR
ncbi:hypothetical protein PUN28_011335 [Cardiocondyla obscurior]